MLLGPQALDAEQLLALVGQVLGLALVLHDVEYLAGGRSSVESEYRYRSGGVGLVDFLAALVEHGLDPAVEAAAEHDVSHMESAVLHQYCGQVAAPLVQGGLDDGTLGAAPGVGLELEEVSLQEDFLEELVHVYALLGRYLLAGLSILLMANIMGTPAAWAWLMASTVWGMMASSAAMMMITRSVILAPRARMAVKAS